MRNNKVFAQPSGNMIAALRRDQRGASAVEFGLIALPFFTLLIGIFDIGHSYYGHAILSGAINNAARSSTLERNNESQAEMDEKVLEQIQAVNPGATATFDRKSFKNFSDANAPEKFTDGNNNGKCDAGEQYEDLNNNNSWDKDAGANGQGGASDAVIYTVSVQYPRLFPLAGFIGGSNVVDMKAQTVLRNQPFSTQAAPKARICK